MSVNNCIRVGVLTVSDRCYEGLNEDISGPALISWVNHIGWKIMFHDIVPDDLNKISSMLKEWVESGEIDLLLTTGGTGFTPRDLTPEATSMVIDRYAPGLVEAMRAESVKITPHGMLSRAIAGISKETLIVNLPGNPKAALENISVISPVIPHAINLLHMRPDAETGHRYIENHN